MKIKFSSHDIAYMVLQPFMSDPRLYCTISTDGEVNQPNMSWKTEMWLRDKRTIASLKYNIPIYFTKENGDEPEPEHKPYTYPGLFSKYCDVCRYRQKNLDPEGCFKQVSSTGFIGRLIITLIGCDRYERI